MDKVKIQQGDLILCEVNKIPETVKKINVTGNKFIVLKGEGVNTHELQSSTLSDDIEAYSDGDVLYLHIKKDTDLIHQEHGTVRLREGIVKRTIEREWDYEAMESRQTKD